MAKRKPACVVCVFCGCILLAVAIIAIILAFTILKPKKPETDVLDVYLDNFNANLGTSGLSLKVSINITLGLVLSVYNPNSASMKYTQSYSSVLYHGDEVANVPIPAGQIGAKGTEIINTTLAFYADKILSDSNLVGDFLSGSLPFSTVTNLSGRVKILNLISRHVRISSQCSFSVAVKNASIVDTQCQNSVKL